MNTTFARRTRKALPATRHPSEIARLVIYGSLLMVSLTVEDGWVCHVAATVGIVVSLAIQVLRPAPFYRLTMLWEAGFLLIVTLEGWTAAENIVASVDRASFDIASQYLIAANAALMLAHDFTFRERDYTLKPWLRTARLNRQAPLVMIAVIYVLYLVRNVPLAMSFVVNGRNGTWVTMETLSTFQAIYGGIALACGLILCPIIAYYVLWLRRGRAIDAMLFCSPILVIQLLIGTRFHFLFASVGLAIVCLAARPLSFKAVLRLGAVAAVVLVVSTTMVKLRDTGAAQAGAAALTSGVSARELALAEGTVVTMAMVVDYFNIHDYMYGASNLGIAGFWIPRSLWPDKPMFMGYWFPRAYGLTGFNEVHSVAGSFAADGYMDFGFYGGILFYALLGVGFGFVERWCARTISRQGHPMIVVAATLYGAVFFAVRSLDTVIVSMVGVAAVGVLFAGLVVRQPRHERRRAVRVQAGPSYAHSGGR